MDTTVTKDPSIAAGFIRRGETAAFPTETVYGLGADALQSDAVRKIFRAKDRPADNPLIVHVAATDQVNAVAATVNAVAETLMDRFWPGPLTVILPKAEAVPDVVTAGLDTVGVRRPRHEVAHAFLTACDTPVAAPSANRSGRPSPTTWTAVRDDLDGRIACILRGGPTEVGLESTVVDCTGAAPTVLRVGATSVEDLRAALSGVTVRVAPDAEQARRSPGTRHRHYAPEIPVALVDEPDDVPDGPAHAYIGLAAPPAPDRLGPVYVADTPEDYGRVLFHFFRRCEAAGCAAIYCQRVEETGRGRALMDRIRRAAAGAAPDA